MKNYISMQAFDNFFQFDKTWGVFVDHL